MQVGSRLKLLAVAVSLASAAGLAQADPWTFTTSGVIGSGFDFSGTFFPGVPYTNLAGMSFTETTTVDPSLYATQYAGTNYQQGYGGNVPYSVTVTINGITKTFSGDIEDSNGADVSNFATQYGGNFYDVANQSNDGYTADGTRLDEDQSIMGSNPENLGPGFNQTWSYSPVSSDQYDSWFSLSGADGNVSFQSYQEPGSGTSGSVNTFAINTDPANVPEPASLTLAGLGLLSLAAVRRQAKQAR